MEFASLEDAYGDITKKKKLRPPRRSKEGFQAYEVPPTDPDRPAVKRMDDIPPINTDEADEYLDESTKFQMKPTVNNSLPSPRSINQPASRNDNSYFGAEPFTNPNEDTMAPFNSHVDHPNGYMLESDFTKSFDQPGFGKSAGTALPIPELRHRWKPLSVDRVDTAFIHEGKGLEMGDMAAMKSKLDALMARLDDLEYRSAGANPQMEMLSFIMTGLFLMFVLDITVSKSASH
jgi:hypothetical protein